MTGHYAVGLGRVESFYVDPNDNQRIYLGSRSGGFWKTLDGGVSWLVSSTDFLVASGVNTISVSPTEPDSVLINVRNAKNGTTHGVYRSTDGGNNWAVTAFNPTNLGWGGLGSNRQIYVIKQHPTIPDLIFVGTNNGLYRSTDNLASWTQLLSSYDIKEIEFHPTNANILYASANNDQSNIFVSTDTGQNFSTSPIPGNTSGVHLSTSSACASCVYIGTSDGIWKSTDEGTSFSLVSTPGLSNYGAFGVNDLDDNVMLFGNIDVNMSTDGGLTFNQTTYWSQGNAGYATNGAYVHADIRGVDCFNGVFWINTDGFLCKSSDNGITWEIFEGQGIRENYNLGVSQSNHDRTISGSQDNGTSINTESGWIEFYGADGMEGIIHPLNDDWMIGSLQYGGRRRTKDGGLSQDGVTPPNQNGYWIAPLFYNPNDQMTVYSLGENVYRSEDFGSNWVNAGTPNFTGEIKFASIAENNSDIIVAVRNENIELSTNGGASFTDIQGSLPNYSITDVAFDPNDDNVIVVTYGRYQNDNSKVFITTDQGQSWQNITYNLNNMPVRAVVIDHTANSNIYLGTEIGVYQKTMTGNSWSLFSQDLPNMTVLDMEIMKGTNTLRSATWGRGIWEVPIVGHENFPSITNTSMTNTPSENAPAEGVPQYVQAVINSTISLTNVYVEWSANSPSFGNVINMSNSSGNNWESDSPLPNQPAGTKMFFKVVAVNANSEMSETYKFMYTVHPYAYCEALGTDTDGNLYISQASVANMSNSSVNDSYTYYQNNLVELEVDQSYTMTLNANTGWSSNDYAAWIDYNADAVFDQSEQILLSIGPGSVATGNFTVPNSALIDSTLRMRIRLSYWGSNPSPCGNTLGEVEDYPVRISGLACPDADNDGVCDVNDQCPGFDDTVDTDGDGIADGCDNCPNDNPDDTDADGICDSNDQCPGFDDTIDSDGDGIADGCDQCPGFDDTIDSDSDGIADDCDICPNDNPDDSDADGTCDSNDQCPGFDDTIDSDGDGTADGCDLCPGFDDTLDSDGDGIANGCDICPDDNPNDSDSDGVCDSNDQCPGFDDTLDSDGDGTADGCDICPNDNPNDTDGDGVCDSNDQCPGFDDTIDSDGDGTADGCDICPNDNPNDSDGDGVCDSNDQCPGFDDTLDSDGDGTADGCDICPNDNPNDSDGDGVCDSNDQCPGFDDTLDSDGDGIADGCDICPNDNPNDSDGDGVCASLDPNDNDPCVPDSNSPLCDPCSTLVSDSFDSNFGNWNDGGSDCARTTLYPNSGTHSVRIRDNSGASSSVFSDAFDLVDYDEVVISFSYYPESMENGEDFMLEYSLNNGSSYSTIQTWVANTDFSNLNRYDESVSVTGISFSSQTRFRFRCDASNNGDRIYLDDISIETCGGTCTPDTSCDDGDECTTNDIYDANCNCAGTFIDTDGDTVCDANDQCPGFDDLLDGDGDSIPDDCDVCPNDNPNDSDGDGVCDSDDQCPGFDDNVDSDGDGTADGCDPCPLDNPNDSDNDGVCDSNDQCPGLDDALAGTSCPDDGDDCTVDLYDSNCNCFHTYTDQDGDGVCIGQDADDNDPCVPDQNHTNCNPCPSIDSQNFDSGWGIWNDGGSDCRRSANDAAYAYSGSYCIRLRDNTSTSVMTTDNLDLSSYEEINIDFTYITSSMENGEDFWLQLSTDGGANYSTVGDWNSNVEFFNNQREFESVTIEGPFTSTTKLRFRCDASGNNDRVYIDDVEISTCSSAASLVNPGNTFEGNNNHLRNDLLDLHAYPIPTESLLMLDLSVLNNVAVRIELYNVTGQLVKELKLSSIHEDLVKLDLSELHEGLYFIRVLNEIYEFKPKLIIKSNR